MAVLLLHRRAYMNLLETKRLIVKPTSLENIENVYALFSDPEVMRYVGRGIKTREEIRESLEEMIKHKEKHGFSFGDVYEKDTGLFVGRAGLIYLEMKDDQPDIEVGYILHKQFWKKGYATELARALLDWGFKHLSVNKLVAVIRPENEESRCVLEKSGMHYVGRENCYDTEVAKYEIFKNKIDYEKIQLIPATIQDYPTIQNVGRFYVYDMSEYMGSEEGWEMPENGLYECIDFKKYWDAENSFSFLVRYKNEIAGFVIVDKKGSATEIDFNMAQFFVLRKFKNKGLGRYIAHECFKKFAGVWEVMVIPGNEGAYRFWRSTIRNYTHNNFAEYTRDIAHFNNNRKNIFKFNSKNMGK